MIRRTINATTNTTAAETSALRALQQQQGGDGGDAFSCSSSPSSSTSLQSPARVALVSSKKDDKDDEDEAVPRALFPKQPLHQHQPNKKSKNNHSNASTAGAAVSARVACYYFFLFCLVLSFVSGCFNLYHSVNQYWDLIVSYQKACSQFGSSQDRGSSGYHNHINNNHNNHEDYLGAAMLWDILSSTSKSSSTSSSSSLSQNRTNEENHFLTEAAAARFNNTQNTALASRDTSQKSNNSQVLKNDYPWLVADANGTSDWTIFYNIFLHPKAALRGIRIVREQMQQLQASHAVTGAPASVTTIPLYYNLIDPSGNPNLLSESQMKEICQTAAAATPNNTVAATLDCVQLHRYTEANEEVTLQSVYDYCHDHPHKQVMYFHNKGSYHDLNGKNAHWRKYLLTAISSQECLTMRAVGNQEPECNACGHQFFPTWGPFFAGNFWTADCSYIQHLLTPSQYRMQMESHILYVKEKLEPAGLIHRRLFATDFETDPEGSALMAPELVDERICRGRFAAECWIGSHPLLRPCDFAMSPQIILWQSGEYGMEMMQFHPAPRRGLMHFKWFLMKMEVRNAYMKRITTTTTTNTNNPTTNSSTEDEEAAAAAYEWKLSRVREYFFLSGHVLKWMALYNNTVPPSDSWVWTWFPDAELFQKAIQIYGNQAVSILLQGNRTVLDDRFWNTTNEMTSILTAS